jgi:hypothetical protein
MGFIYSSIEQIFHGNEILISLSVDYYLWPYKQNINWKLNFTLMPSLQKIQSQR